MLHLRYSLFWTVSRDVDCTANAPWGKDIRPCRPVYPVSIDIIPDFDAVFNDI